MGYPFSHVVKCWCGTIAARFSQVAQRLSHDLVFPSLMYLLGAMTIACCLCHLVRATPHLLLAKWRNLPSDRSCSFSVVHLRTVVFLQIRMISFQSGFAVLPSCDLLHDFRLFRLTLRPSALVFRRHRVSWARERLAFAQEAVRVSPFSFSSIFLLLLIFARSFRQPSRNFSSCVVEM